MTKELKPFDKILVRNSIMGQKGYWIPAFYGAHPNDRKFLTSAGWQDECIPYEGNEGYLGTNKDYVCRISPELKESEDEDERIRKELIDRIECFNEKHMLFNNGVSKNKVIAWLEKQGNQKLADTDNKFIRMRETKPKNIFEFLERLTTAEQEFLWEHIAKIRELDKEDCELEKQGECHISHDDEIMIEQLTEYFTTGHGLQNTNGTVVEWLADVKRKLEKQGEQKHTPKHKVGDTIYYNSFGEVKSMIVINIVTDNTDNPMYEDKEGNAVFEKDLVEQKPINKVEPKFKKE